MSIEITAKIICDQCGAVILGDVQRQTSRGQSSYYSAKRKAEQARWMFNGRYGKTKHICQPCADGVTTFIFDKNTEP